MSTMFELYTQASKLHGQLHELLLASALRLYDSGETDLAKQVYYRSQAERMAQESYAIKARNLASNDGKDESRLDADGNRTAVVTPSAPSVTNRPTR